jgi:transcriptional regulator with XRE-family HTH domain
MQIAMLDDQFPFREQLRLLIQTIPAPDGSEYDITAIANATGLSAQSLLYMLDGRTSNPRLDSLRNICWFYDISLDYFECSSEEECRSFLAQNAAQRASSLVHEIDQKAEALTPSDKSRVLRLIDRLNVLRRLRKH